MLVSTDTMLGLGGKMFHNVFSLFIFCKQRFKFYQNFLVFNVPCQGWGGGDVSYHLFISCIKIILKYSAYQCCMPPMADKLSSCCTVIDVWSTLEISGFRVLVWPTVTRSCQFYSISSSYVSVVIIRKHWKQEHWRCMVGDLWGFSNCRGFFKDFLIQ